MVMMSMLTQQYLATIWSLLLEGSEFVNWWEALSLQEKTHELDVLPYQGVSAYSPNGPQMMQMMALEKEERRKLAQMQATQHHQQQMQMQLPSQSAPKRNVDAVESAEAAPSPRRPAQAAPVASMEPPEQVPDDEVNEEAIQALLNSEMPGMGPDGSLRMYGEDF